MPLLLADRVGNAEDTAVADVLLDEVTGSVVSDDEVLELELVEIAVVTSVLTGAAMLDDTAVPMGPAVETLVPSGAVPEA